MKLLEIDKGKGKITENTVELARGQRSFKHRQNEDSWSTEIRKIDKYISLDSPFW